MWAPELHLKPLFIDQHILTVYDIYVFECAVFMRKYSKDFSESPVENIHITQD